MEAWLEHSIAGLSSIWLICLLAIALFILGKAADFVVDEAVFLSSAWGIPQAIVGATLVSLGTTLPEAVISVLAAIKGSPGLALGNAIGSIICDTALILGIGILITPIPISHDVKYKQGWLQFGAGILLFALCVPWSSLSNYGSVPGNLSQLSGFFLVFLLIVYMIYLISSGRKQQSQETSENSLTGLQTASTLFKLFLGIAIVILSSHVLIPSVKEAAIRLSIPESIIAASLIAFGTSLPELVTVITACLKGRGELALGNVIGADVLNVLFVAGLSAAVTPAGLEAPIPFLKVLFPMMLLVLFVFRVGSLSFRTHLPRFFGVILLLLYVTVTWLSYQTL